MCNPSEVVEKTVLRINLLVVPEKAILDKIGFLI